MDFIWLSIAIVIAGYFIGDGLKNFNNPDSKNLMDYLDENDEHEMIKESNIHHFLGVCSCYLFNYQNL